ncbi:MULTISPECIES: hypothetical protein [unclassified Variovorax]|uniref:hypothetical protein n=1 Tax=unclassified Variovorax TaxID=663243 RepID=UPI00076BF970|nr:MULTISPECIES: hypothetical protein [unclassified Variovorax]KWT98173.1 hypothetical protein APY03_0844 [Variovorax sp. WDL1]PNG50339.1 hypothetical protein CHC06_05962 [Variovorax sp. B2]PNG51212.1 hypothetical protein CHC07_05868 [Variovorax sp. B4]VTV17437.1 hypothetical protein WDL1P1_00389 [Variovorax sp. WDL1]
MKPELDQALCEKYPLVFKDRRGDPSRTLMCFGFEVGDGWYSLLDALGSLLEADHRAAVREYEHKRSIEGTVPYKGAERVSAVDVERARLAMSAAADRVPVAVQVKEKFGTLRFYVSGASDVQYAYIAFAEAMSARTCEVCGAPGELRNSGWIRTLCDVHDTE